jgi:hypothetical protein
MLPENLILENEPTKTWREAELVIKFRLNPIKMEVTPLLEEWLNAPLPNLNEIEQYLFEKYLRLAKQDLNSWNEEELKMKFITHIISLGLLENGDGITTCFDRGLSGVIEGVPLSVKTDFMVASGYQNVIQQPFFHFQEYKPSLNPTGEPMAQLLEAFMIAQTLNKKNIPLYGAEIVGEHWKFVVMEGKDYCISSPYACTVREDLMQIIAILRKFKEILETRLLKM